MALDSLPGRALLIALALPAMGAIPVDVCVEPSFDAAVAIMRLDDRTPSLRLRPVRPAACTAADRHRLRFVERGGRLLIELSPPGGSPLARQVPWGGRAADAIVAFDRQGRTGAVAVMIEGLIIEERTARLTAPPAPEPAPPAPEPVPPAPEPVQPEPVQPEPVQPAPEPVQPAPPPRRPAPRATPTRTPPAPRTPPPDPPPPEPPPLPPPPPPEPSPFPPEAAPAAPPPTALRVTPPIEDPPAPTPAPPTPVELALSIGGALREPTVIGAELAARAIIATALAEIGWQPDARWSLDGRPLDTGALWFALGWAPTLVHGGALRLDARLCAVAERATVQRADVADATRRAEWQLGASGGLELSHPIFAGPLRIGGLLDARWLPTASAVVIPQGPRSPFDRWQVRAAVTMAWQR